VRDNESKTFDIPVLTSPGVKVTDLDLRTIIGGDAFNNNLRMKSRVLPVQLSGYLTSRVVVVRLI
jgi:hypothetical protein